MHGVGIGPWANFGAFRVAKKVPGEIAISVSSHPDPLVKDIVQGDLGDVATELLG